jgi:hypothetical protein
MIFRKRPSTSPTEGVGDLPRFLASRTRTDWLFLIPAFLVTAFVVYGFYKDSTFKRPYKRNIIYAESWPLTRTDAEIHAQQIIDAAKKKRELAEIEKQQKAHQAELKKYDDWLTNHGI